MACKSCYAVHCDCPCDTCQKRSKELPILTIQDLEALDKLEVTHPNLWRYIRELGQAVIVLTGNKNHEREQ